MNDLIIVVVACSGMVYLILSFLGYIYFLDDVLKGNIKKKKIFRRGKIPGYYLAHVILRGYKELREDMREKYHEMEG